MRTAIKSEQKQAVDSVHPQLPDADLREENRALRDQIEAQQRQIAAYEKLIRLYEEAERLAKIQHFAPSSEKSRFQFNLFDEAELEEALSDLEQQIESAEAAEQGKKKTPRKKREGFSPELPRVRVELTLTDEEKAGAVNSFFSKVKEELDIIPAQARVIEYWQEKAVFGEEIGENTIISVSRVIQNSPVVVIENSSPVL